MQEPYSGTNGSGSGMGGGGPRSYAPGGDPGSASGGGTTGYQAPSPNPVQGQHGAAGGTASHRTPDGGMGMGYTAPVGWPQDHQV